ncbi:thiosulfate oxidation carrier complex protein SoxZ [Terrarubrum flagellatum]|uniref:thiosulfate oxidation carrier complex protein SoxZ n=1 Tax=Terrirubrum flagellatum TaxID=2895980 RepID=UPI003144F6A4
MANALITAPKTAIKGEVITLKAMFAHPMETGYRHDISGDIIPRDILHTFICRYAGEVVFRSDFFPAVAANPFISFTTIATKSGPLEFTWIGDDGQTHTETVPLTVT